MFATALLLSTSLVSQDSSNFDRAQRLEMLPSLGKKPPITRTVEDHSPRRLEIKFTDGANVALIAESFQGMSA